jgi:hypothetical protein
MERMRAFGSFSSRDSHGADACFWVISEPRQSWSERVLLGHFGAATVMERMRALGHFGAATVMERTRALGSFRSRDSDGADACSWFISEPRQ